MSTTALKVEPGGEGGIAAPVISLGEGIGLAVGAVTGISAISMGLVLVLRKMGLGSKSVDEDRALNLAETDMVDPPKPFKLSFSIAPPPYSGAAVPARSIPLTDT